LAGNLLFVATPNPIILFFCHSELFSLPRW